MASKKGDRDHAPGTTLSPEKVAAFRKMLHQWYHAHARTLPWRETFDPYAILVSEIMLQQTQVDRVRGKYGEFIASFPDFSSLARAPLEVVLSAWQGLGYNRRAIALKRCAVTVVDDFGGVLPATVEKLELLPGIGPYTARAIAAFAFDLPTVFIETNIRTVFIHHFCGNREGVTDRELLPLVAATLDREAPRDWYYALMDYGVMLKREYPNPGRRSAHHQRQSPFRGSNRELRSIILRGVLANPGIATTDLVAQVGADQEKIRENLAGMAREGFIRLDGDRLFIGMID